MKQVVSFEEYILLFEIDSDLSSIGIGQILCILSICMFTSGDFS